MTSPSSCLASSALLAVRTVSSCSLRIPVHGHRGDRVGPALRPSLLDLARLARLAETAGHLRGVPQRALEVAVQLGHVRQVHVEDAQPGAVVEPLQPLLGLRARRRGPPRTGRRSSARASGTCSRGRPASGRRVARRSWCRRWRPPRPRPPRPASRRGSRGRPAPSRVPATTGRGTGRAPCRASTCPPAAGPPCASTRTGRWRARRRPGSGAVRRVQRVPERGPQVGVLALQLAEPVELVVVDDVLAEVARHRQVAGDEPVADVRLAARGGELLGAELADGVEHLVPRRLARAGVVPGDHRLVHQPDHRVEDLAGPQLAARAHLLGRIDAEAPGEDRQPRPQRLLGRRAQVVAPADGVAQRPVPGVAALAAAGQQRQPTVEPLVDAGRPDRPAAAPAAGRRPARWRAACRRAEGRAGSRRPCSRR